MREYVVVDFLWIFVDILAAEGVNLRADRPVRVRQRFLHFSLDINRAVPLT